MVRAILRFRGGDRWVRRPVAALVRGEDRVWWSGLGCGWVVWGLRAGRGGSMLGGGGGPWGLGRLGLGVIEPVGQIGRGALTRCVVCCL